MPSSQCLEEQLANGSNSARAIGGLVTPSKGDRLELDLLRKHQRQYAFTAVPVGVLFLALAMQPVFSGERVEELRKVGWRIGLLASSKALWHLIVDATDLQVMKSRCMFLEQITILHRFMMQGICLAYDGIWGSTLLRGLSLIIMPLSTARQCTCFWHFSLYVCATILLTLFWFREDPGGQGWQWLCLTGLTTTISADIVARRFEADGAFQSLNTTCTAMHGLLSMICDGFVLLDDDGAIVAVDQKVAHMLGKDLNSKWVGLDFKQFVDLDACGQMPDLKRGNWQGLEKLILLAGNGERLDVETYNVPCIVQPHCMPLILGHDKVPDNVRASTHFCAIRVVQVAWDNPSPLPGPDDVVTQRTASVRSAPRSDRGVDRLERLPHRGSFGSGDLPAFQASLRVEEASDVSTEHGQEMMQHSDMISDVGDIRSEGSVAHTMRSMAMSSKQVSGPGQTFLDSPLKMIPALGLGGGAYTVVRNVAHSFNSTVMQVKGIDDTTYALKRIKLPGVLWQRDFPRNLRNLDREVRSLKTLSWASGVIVCLIDCWLEVDFQYACIVMEWLPMTLAKLLEGRSRGALGPLDLKTACRYAAQLSVGLTVIHSACLMHRDLKPSNILISGDLESCKIADLGLSRSVQPQAPQGKPWGNDDCIAPTEDGVSEAGESQALSLASRYTHNVGTRAYASPEISLGGAYDERVDVFSLGCVFFEMLTLRRTAELRTDPEPDEVSLPTRAQQVFEEANYEAGEPDDAEGDEHTSAGSSVGRRREDLQELCLRMLHPRCSARPAADDIARAPVLQPSVLDLLRKHPELQRILPKAVNENQALSEHSEHSGTPSPPAEAYREGVP